MGKGGVILGLIGLLVGASGLGFGIINYINQPTGPAGPTTYYVYEDATFTPNPDLVYIPIPNLSIVFEIDSPVSLHLLFTCSARCLGDALSFYDLIFYFMINDVRQTNMPWARTGGYQSNTNYEYSTVSLQHYFILTTPGIYNITVTVLTEYLGNFIRESSLWIESYPA
ncbi:MAG: hypothetical protein EAX91_08225 [Candidatus Lokiarchaeota archaeon]|nr:hypothetical protein [Candidatus Lokiarchaeota archaeon]